jgi:hypothetical protein
VQLLADKGVLLDVAPDARRWLAEQGYDVVYGARPLVRPRAAYSLLSLFLTALCMCLSRSA